MTQTLTRFNAHRAQTVQSIDNPEWGTKRFNYNEQRLGYHRYTHTIGVGSNRAILDESEFKHWEVVSWKYDVNLEDLTELAIRSHSGTSFSPEERGIATIADYERCLLSDLKQVPTDQQEWYISKYKEYVRTYLSRHSRVMSSMITGPANFPTRRNERANNSCDKAIEEFSQWRERTTARLAKQTEQDRRNSLSPSQRYVEDFKPLKIEILETYANPASWKKALLYGMLERRALKGEVELMELSIALILDTADQLKPIFTPRHKVWKLVELAQASREKLNDRQEQETTVEDMGVCEVHRNFEADRLQLLFDGKPVPAVISILKSNGYRWSPRFGAWQRQLTLNATRGLDRVLSQIKEAM